MAKDEYAGRFQWIVICDFEGRRERMETDDAGIEDMIRELITNPSRARPDILKQLTRIKVYKLAADISIPRPLNVDILIESLRIPRRALEERIVK